MMTDLLTQLSSSDRDTSLIRDPWELPSPTTIAKEGNRDQAQPITVEAHPLIAPSGNPNALFLPSPKLTSISVLLQDWLKLPSEAAKTLTEQCQEALGLLYWMETMPS